MPVAKIPLSASEHAIEEAEPNSDRHGLERVLPDIIFRGVHGLDRAILRAPGLPLGDITNCRGEFLDIALIASTSSDRSASLATFRALVRTSKAQSSISR